MNEAEKRIVMNRLGRLAWLMDDFINIPGTKFKVGFDPLLGLLPWLGDAAGSVVSSFMISEAARLGVPKSLLLKMAFNIIMDALLGVLPLVGDIFDLGWKANSRNFKLLEKYLEKPRKTVIESRFFVVILIVLIVGFVIFLGTMVFLMLQALWNAVNT
jgi:hypothetical protein